ncbi:hypothetical protein [Saccharopolyspora elongata]|uniref:Secreted protein n=1 Tax=Saccharopolyspora elongata TaxID=2530387 RepID=A0A4R4Z1C6_9PSEU|nr:hypothetical protein [Saccharopolyspora elongata]TDD51728.1 hypothetical protein E1288_14265 [Saccharopolyspora elongata]
MNTAAKLAAYGALVALGFGGAWITGTAVGPLTPGTAQAHAGHPDGGNAGDAGDHSGTVAGATQDQTPAGLTSTRGGYTLAPTTTLLAPETTDEFSFRITGADGRPVTRFDVEHDKWMHLIVVRRDTAGYQHLHPEISPDGTWHVPMRLPGAGTYRVFADFTPTGGEGQTLGVDVSAPGAFSPITTAPSRLAEVDGYQVRLDGELVAGRSSPVTLTVRKDGRPVTDLQPYLAAYGHLVALRTGDLAYLHVHPTGSPGDGRTPAGPGIAFQAEVPSGGAYRLFLDFQHGGTVRTAEFTVNAQEPADGQHDPAPTGDGHGGHG